MSAAPPTSAVTSAALAQATLPGLAPITPAALKKAVGDCLRGNGNYSPLLEEMPRCWRLNYANEFHLDITPSIPNPNCPLGGELVPDKTLKEWMTSNPKAYKWLFEQRANRDARPPGTSCHDKVLALELKGLRREFEAS